MSNNPVYPGEQPTVGYAFKLLNPNRIEIIAPESKKFDSENYQTQRLIGTISNLAALRELFGIGKLEILFVEGLQKMDPSCVVPFIAHVLAYVNVIAFRADDKVLDRWLVAYSNSSKYPIGSKVSRLPCQSPLIPSLTCCQSK